MEKFFRIASSIPVIPSFFRRLFGRETLLLNNSEQLLRSFRRKERSYTSIPVNVGQEERLNEGGVGAITTSNVKPFITRTPFACLTTLPAFDLPFLLIPFDCHIFFLFIRFLFIYKFRHEIRIKFFHFLFKFLLSRII